MQDAPPWHMAKGRGTRELWQKSMEVVSGWGVERNTFLASEILLSVLIFPCQNDYGICKIGKPLILQTLVRATWHPICRKRQKGLQEFGAERQRRTREQLLYPNENQQKFQEKNQVRKLSLKFTIWGKKFFEKKLMWRLKATEPNKHWK